MAFARIWSSGGRKPAARQISLSISLMITLTTMYIPFLRGATAPRKNWRPRFVVSTKFLFLWSKEYCGSWHNGVCTPCCLKMDVRVKQIWKPELYLIVHNPKNLILSFEQNSPISRWWDSSSRGMHKDLYRRQWMSRNQYSWTDSWLISTWQSSHSLST